ncbi:hypothetical protein GCM10027091_51960 [Streptomyces daliensis]
MNVPRLRIKVTYCPRRALALTDAPRPDCPGCRGVGGIAHDYGDHNGEYAGTHWEPCPCWTQRAVTLLPLPALPRWLHRRRRGTDPWAANGSSDEPPF